MTWGDTEEGPYFMIGKEDLGALQRVLPECIAMFI